MMFRFAYPVLLVLLTGVVGYLVFEILKKPVAITHSMTARLADLAHKGSGIWQRIPLVLRALCLVLLVLTAARPQFYNVSREIRSPGVDIVMCIDTSGSMQALDLDLLIKSVRAELFRMHLSSPVLEL
jgi:Ca-activated chloride channel family protein